MESTPDYKKQAAAEAFKRISKNQVIGLGAGTTIAHLVDMIAMDKELAGSLTLVSSSFTTTNKIIESGLSVQPPAYLKRIDSYFDGCDQFDKQLNALKSGGGIHTTEKILASMANEFILLGDSGKMADTLDSTYPLVVEILLVALPSVMNRLATQFPNAVLNLRKSDQKDGALMSDYGNCILNIKFETFPDLEIVNAIKMIPGVLDHSLFYKMASSAIIAGPNGIETVLPA